MSMSYHTIYNNSTCVSVCLHIANIAYNVIYNYLYLFASFSQKPLSNYIRKDS